MNDQLRQAMHNVDLEAIDAIATEIGATAVRTALAVHEPDREDRLREKQCCRRRRLSASAISTRRSPT